MSVLGDYYVWTVIVFEKQFVYIVYLQFSGKQCQNIHAGSTIGCPFNGAALYCSLNENNMS